MNERELASSYLLRQNYPGGISNETSIALDVNYERICAALMDDRECSLANRLRGDTVDGKVKSVRVERDEGKGIFVLYCLSGCERGGSITESPDKYCHIGTLDITSNLKMTARVPGANFGRFRGLR
jgi:hypothetical protein